MKKSDTKNNRQIKLSDIGVIARDAFLAYRRYYPNTIIIMGSPYNPKVLMAQFVDKIQCFNCYGDDSSKQCDCNSCPVTGGVFFDFARVQKSTGSKTPYVNVDLGSFEPITEFFEKLNIRMDSDAVKQIEATIKREKLIFSPKCSEANKNKVRWTLNQNGCDWVKYNIYTCADNNYIHFDHDCKWLKKAKCDIEEENVSHLKRNNKRTCMTCCKSLSPSEE